MSNDISHTAAEIMAETQNMLRLLVEEQVRVRAMLEAHRIELMRKKIVETFADCQKNQDYHEF